MKINDGILTEDKFEEGTKLFPQNTVDGTALIDKPTEDILPNSIFVVTPCMGTLMLSYVKAVLELQIICFQKVIIIEVISTKSAMKFFYWHLI